MSGFFNIQQTQSTERMNGKPLSCAACGLYKYAKSPKMTPYGNFKKGILCIGEAPGEIEDDRGLPWQGKTGRLLQRILKKKGIDLFDDCLSINSINCRPKNNRTPNQHEISCCNNVLVNKVILEYQPKLIFLFGGSALSSVIGSRWKKDLGGIMKWRGFQIPDKDFKCWICPVFHPSYIERMDKKEVETVWENDIDNALCILEEPLPRYKKPEIIELEDLSILNEVRGEISFDYETTGIKPYATGHKIICTSVAVDDQTVYAFMNPPRKEMRPFFTLLKNRNISKMAHNMKFEHTWTKIIYGVDVEGWSWDSMLAAHLIDNRQGITGLKFQTYINFGVVDYSSEIEPYLQSGSKNKNAINRIEKLLESPTGKNKLLTYCGLDSIYQRRLAGIQMEKIDFSYLPF